MHREEEVVYLYLDDIIPNRFQPREVFEERPLKELAVSIKEHGVIQPIIVRKVNDKYEIIAGERRYKASALAGLTKIPAIIRDLDDKETSKVALLENLQRKNLNPIEEAKTYQKILELDQMTQEELAKTMGKSQSAVANKLRLLSLSEEVQDALLKENISERHARSLLNLKTVQEQKDMLEKIINNKMTVRQVEEEIKGKNKNTNDILEKEKIDDKVLEISNVKDVPTAENYIPINPLMPNFNGENTDSNTPILTNVPSLFDDENDEIDDQQTAEPKFINFGDINKEDLYENESNDNPDDFEVNIEDIKAKANDIGDFSNNSEFNQGLDSLLRIEKNPSTDNLNDSQFKFFSPARDAIRESENNVSTDEVQDYFKAPELVSVNLPDMVQTNNVSGMSLEENQSNDNSSNKFKNPINVAIEIIRSSVEKIENIGLKVEKEELDLDKSYQVTIKIEKEQE